MNFLSLYSIIVIILFSFLQLDLSPSEEEEWVALQEQLAEEEQERRELEERKKEICDKIETKSSEVAQAKRSNTELQCKV